MTSVSLPVLRDNADHLAVLAGVFQTHPAELKAQAIRRADKCLVALEAFFTTDIYHEANMWLKATESIQVIEGRMAQLEKVKLAIAILNQKQSDLKNTVSKWAQVDATDRQLIMTKANATKIYLNSRQDVSEAHVLHKYRRYNALRNLLPYADNVDLLCESIHHYQNRERYEESIQKHKAKIETADERLRSVKRGFILALCFCIFLVTIPLCGPFAYSLWVRRREIESQISNARESIRREERRLEAADEGVIAQQEIKTILGDLPLEQIRNILNEVRDLRAEFNAHGSNQSAATASLLNFFESYKDKLTDLFGPVPSDPIDSFKWLVEVTADTQQNEAKLQVLDRDMQEQLALQAKITRGHNISILYDALNRLKQTESDVFAIPIEEGLKRNFADLVCTGQKHLQTAREMLWLICNAQPVDISRWEQTRTQIESMSNTFNACIVSAEIEKNWGGAHASSQYSQSVFSKS